MHWLSSSFHASRKIQTLLVLGSQIDDLVHVGDDQVLSEHPLVLAHVLLPVKGVLRLGEVGVEHVGPTSRLDSPAPSKAEAVWA